MSGSDELRARVVYLVTRAPKAMSTADTGDFPSRSATTDLYVDDHARALWTVLRQGQPGETYNIGGHNEQRNIDVVREICRILDSAAPARKPRAGFESLITFVKDRPGHDRRYAIDATRIRTELGWTPARTFTEGLRETAQWYIDNRAAYDAARTGYDRQRLGLAAPAGAGRET